MRRRFRQTITEWGIRRAVESAGRQAAKDPALRAHLERFDADARPVLDALADAGLRVKRLGDLTDRDIDYTEQIPVLIAWLPRVQYAPVKMTLAAALAVRAARPAAAPALLDELRRAPDPIENAEAQQLRVSLGQALAFTADVSYFDAIAELIEDPATGSARPILIEDYLGRFPGQRDRAVPILRRLLRDDDLGRYALKPLARLRAVEARAEIERFLQHEQAWVRHNAKRALARLPPPR